jgi:hypothetical protein
MVSKANDDFPDPLTPVMMMSFPPGSETSIFLRLCVRAPRTRRSVAVAASVGTVSDMLLVAFGIRSSLPITGGGCSGPQSLV